MPRFLSTFAMVIAAALSLSRPLQALSVADFSRYPPERQASFLSGALSILAYSYAANGDVARATCIKTWHLGKPGQESSSSRELAIEIAIAQRSDPDRLAIEGVILGSADKACPSKQFSK